MHAKQAAPSGAAFFVSENPEPVVGFSVNSYCGVIGFRYIYPIQLGAGVAQLAEQLFCKQQVVGSSPSAGFFWGKAQIASSELGGYRSGQTGQTVNLLALPSQVRILLPPLSNRRYGRLLRSNEGWNKQILPFIGRI